MQWLSYVRLIKAVAVAMLKVNYAKASLSYAKARLSLFIRPS